LTGNPPDWANWYPKSLTSNALSIQESPYTLLMDTDLTNNRNIRLADATGTTALFPHTSATGATKIISGTVATTGAITSNWSGGLTSVTKVGTGHYTLVFDCTDVDSFVATASQTVAVYCVQERISANSYKVRIFDGSYFYTNVGFTFMAVCK